MQSEPEGDRRGDPKLVVASRRSPRGLTTISALCLAASGGMGLLSTLCLCIAGQMVIYFLVAAALALVPFGCDPNRVRRLAGLALVIGNLILAGGDHEGGVRWTREHMQLIVRPATASSPPPSER